MMSRMKLLALLGIVGISGFLGLVYGVFLGVQPAFAIFLIMLTTPALYAAVVAVCDDVVVLAPTARAEPHDDQHEETNCAVLSMAKPPTQTLVEATKEVISDSQ